MLPYPEDSWIVTELLGDTSSFLVLVGISHFQLFYFLYAALKVDPGNANILWDRAALYYQMDNTKKSLESYEMACQVSTCFPLKFKFKVVFTLQCSLAYARIIIVYHVLHVYLKLHGSQKSIAPSSKIINRHHLN